MSKHTGCQRRGGYNIPENNNLGISLEALTIFLRNQHSLIKDRSSNHCPIPEGDDKGLKSPPILLRTDMEGRERPDMHKEGV